MLITDLPTLMCPPCPKTMACVRACVCVCVCVCTVHMVPVSAIRRTTKKIVLGVHDNHSLLPFCIMTLFFFFRVRIRGPHANYLDQPALQIPTCFNPVWTWQRSATHRLGARGRCSSQRFLFDFVCCWWWWSWKGGQKTDQGKNGRGERSGPCLWAVEGAAITLP